MRTNKPQGKGLAVLLTAVFILLGLVIGVGKLLQGEMSRALLGLFTPVCFLVPWFLGKVGLGHPWRLYSMMLLFSILAYDIGCAYQAFDLWPFFDKVSHFLSGIVFTALGFCFYYYLDRGRWTKAVVACTWALFFSIFVAVFWEVCEFSGFLLIGHDSQHHLDTGVFDTMQDLISCLVGSLLSVGAYAWYLRRGVKLVTARVVAEFRALL